MNLIDCYVIKIISEPYYKYNHWWLDVVYDSYGVESFTSIMKKSKEDIDKIKIGYEFQS